MLALGDGMRQSKLKQSYQWALVTPRGYLALFNGQCPIYWSRRVANQECNRRNENGGSYTVDRVTVLAVHRGKS